MREASAVLVRDRADGLRIDWVEGAERMVEDSIWSLLRREAAEEGVSAVDLRC